jgi:hypothetical protein
VTREISGEVRKQNQNVDYENSVSIDDGNDLQVVEQQQRKGTRAHLQNQVHQGTLVLVTVTEPLDIFAGLFKQVLKLIVSRAEYSDTGVVERGGL